MSSKVETVISGIGGIFPKSMDLDEFKELLMENIVTAERAPWVETEIEGTKVQQHNNLPKDRNRVFDATFFNVHRIKARYMDPMTRMFLEKTFEAVIDAGVHPAELRGRNIPVMIASTVSDTDLCIFSAIKGGSGVTGQARAMMANRVSYWLNVHGSSFATDANWCGGVNVIQHAKLMIESGMCEAAIVGATNSAIVPEVVNVMDRMGLMSEDGKTRPYDENAEGYARGDGIVVLFIQRADVAKRNYATILHAEAIFNGNRPQENFVGCDLDGFTNFLDNCYKTSGVKPEDVAYLEVNGCGLTDTDKTELQAVENFFCKNRSSPLQIGSVKANIGHTEPVSGLMSLIKIIVAMETGILPAHVNYRHNPKIPQLNNGKIQIVTKNKEWKGEIAALNTIGLASSLGHLIIRANKQRLASPTTDLPLLLIYSTRTEEGIQKISDSVAMQMQAPDLSYNKLTYDVFATNVTGHLYRSYSLKASKDKSSYRHFAGQAPPIWFVYSGMGSQWQTMGKDLMKLPTFAKAVHKCCEILKPKGVDLMKILTDNDPKIFDNILNSFVGIAAVQIGLTDVLEAIGIVPDGIIGHSVGELGCAYADKCLTAEQMILSAYYRGKASLDAELITGMMAAIGMGYKNLRKLAPEKIDIACHNSPDSSTISGPIEDVKKFVSILQNTGIFAKLVNVSNIAYHSRYIKPAAPYLLEYLKDVLPSPKERSPKWLSTSVPQSQWQTDLSKTVSPEYLTNNLLSSVHFEEVLPFIPANSVVIEIAPHGLLQAILRRALLGDVVNVALTKRDTNCLEFMFTSLGELYLSGLNFNLSPLYPEVPIPVPRGTRSLCSLVQWEHGEKWWNFHDQENKDAVDSTTRTVVIAAREIVYLSSHLTDNKIIVPPVLYFELINESVNKHGALNCVTFEDVIFRNHIELGVNELVKVNIMVQPGTGLFEINYDKTTILTGRVLKNNKEKLPAAILENHANTSIINKSSFYKELNIRGYKYTEELEIVSSISLGQNGFKGTAQNTGDLKVLISAALQMHLFYKGETSQHLLAPKYVQRVHISFDEYANNSDEEVIFWYNDITGILESNNGVHIQGLTYEHLQMAPHLIKFDNLKFVRHFDEHPQDIEAGLNTFTKIVTDNLGKENLTISELKEKFVPKYLPYIKKYLSQKQIEVETIEMNELDYSVLQNSSLTIVSGKFLNIISQIIANVDNYFVFCFPITHSICMSSKYTTVAQFSTNKNRFYLVKKTNVNPVKVINIKEDKVSYKHMQTNSISWTTELKSVSKDAKMRVYLVLRTIPTDGIFEFVEQMKNNVNDGHNLRFLFILDSTAPDCKPGSEFYAQIFEQDLVIQVLKNGSWGSFVDVCESTNVERSRNSAALARAVQSRDFAYKPAYLGLHLTDLTRLDSPTIPCEIGAVDFSGYSALGEKIMGFGQFNLDQCKLSTDSSFVWPVPPRWTMCDAATVPYAYTMAYYTLFTVANISKGDVVLVHAGCSEIGLAAVHVAYNYGCIVYTTVATDVQRSIIKKWLPMIDDENILDSESTDFEVSILSYTKGRGVDVVLNCLPGDRLHASKNLLAHFSRFVQLGTYDMKEHASIGMQIFLKCASFYGVTGQSLLKLPQEVKEQLKAMLTKDIETGVVKPLKRKIFTENRVDDSLRYLRSSTAIGAVISQISDKNDKSAIVADKFDSQIQSEENYLIYADSSDAWLPLVDWLVKQKVTRIIVANQPPQNTDFINRYLSIIKQNNTTEIIPTKHNAYTLENAKLLAKDIYKFGSLKEVFIFDMEEDNNNPNTSAENIDNALYYNKIHARLVCILGSNKEQSYFRKNGLPVCNVVWDNTYTLEEVIKNFDVILSKNNTNIYLKDESVKEDILDETVIIEDDSLFISTTLKTLKQLGHSELKAANIVQLPSCTPKVLRESPPLFIVPGLLGPYCPTLRQFVLQLLFPVFSVQLPTNALTDDIAENLAKQIIATHSSKVYKIVGLSWGGILAIEIAKQLENFGKKIELHLIDGAPQLIRNFTNNFAKNGAFNTTLLKQLVKVDGKSVENILSSSVLSKFDYKDIVKSLTVLKSYIEYSNNYKPLPNKIRGPTVIALTEADSDENPGLIEHCEKIRYQSLKVTHRTLLQSRITIDYINEFLA